MENENDSNFSTDSIWECDTSDLELKKSSSNCDVIEKDAMNEFEAEFMDISLEDYSTRDYLLKAKNGKKFVVSYNALILSQMLKTNLSFGYYEMEEDDHIVFNCEIEENLLSEIVIWLTHYEKLIPIGEAPTPKSLSDWQKRYFKLNRGSAKNKKSVIELMNASHSLGIDTLVGACAYYLFGKRSLNKHPNCFGFLQHQKEEVYEPVPGLCSDSLPSMQTPHVLQTKSGETYEISYLALNMSMVLKDELLAGNYTLKDGKYVFQIDVRDDVLKKIVLWCENHINEDEGERALDSTTLTDLVIWENEFFNNVGHRELRKLLKASQRLQIVSLIDAATFNMPKRSSKGARVPKISSAVLLDVRMDGKYVGSIEKPLIAPSGVKWKSFAYDILFLLKARNDKLFKISYDALVLSDALRECLERNYDKFYKKPDVHVYLDTNVPEYTLKKMIKWLEHQKLTGNFCESNFERSGSGVTHSTKWEQKFFKNLNHDESLKLLGVINFY